MKTLTLFLIGLLYADLSLSQSTKTDNYIIFQDNSNTAYYYLMGESAYLDYFLADKAKIDEHDYSVKLRIYSWGETDTSYYRQDTANFYHYNDRVKEESIVLPKEVVVGQTWIESDSSWSYEIIGVNEKLKTPAKIYKQLIAVKCTQLKDRDKNKSKTYLLYYAKEIGLVASVNDNKIKSYLHKIKRNASDGQSIGE